MSKLEEMKARYAPILTSLGLQTNRNQRIWIDDRGFFLILVELQPLYSEGIFTNVAIHFLWRLQNPNVINYYPEHQRILVPNSPIQEALLYQSPTFEADLQKVFQKMTEKIQFLRSFEKLEILTANLTCRKDFFYYQHQSDCNDADIDLGIAKMLNGDRSGALSVFCNLAKNDTKAGKLLEHCDSEPQFRQYILETTNAARKQFAEKQKCKLPPLSMLPLPE